MGSVLESDGGLCRRYKAMPVRDEARERARIVDQLSQRFPRQRPETVQAAVASAWDQYADAPVRDFVPVLAARATLAALISIDPIATKGTAHRSRATS